MAVKLRIALRDWDYLTPLLLGDVTSPRIALQIDRITTMVEDLATDEKFDGAELSLSRYAKACHDGDERVVGIPNFVMRGFRHRCIITRSDSPLETLGQLAGKRIGVTGWRDTGNTWTRAALRHQGVGVGDAFWFAGRLTSEHPIIDRLEGYGVPGRIEAVPGEQPMVDALSDGVLDAVFTPFMPKGFFGATGSP